MSKCVSSFSRAAALCIGSCALFAATAAWAATVSIYKVTDANGRVTYQNTPPGATAGRVERRAFDLEANAMNFTRPRAAGSPQGGGGNTNNNNEVITRLADELLRRTGGAGTGVSVTRRSGSVVFSDQSTTGVGVLGGGEASGIVTPSGNLVGADNANIGGTAGAATAGSANINPGAGNNAGGGTGMGGGEGTGPAITNPSTGNPTFGGGQTFTGNSPTFTSNSATFSSSTGTLGPATPGIGAGTVGASGNFNNNAGSANGTPANTANNTGAGVSGTAPQTGVAPGTNPFAGSDSVAPRGRVAR